MADPFLGEIKMFGGSFAPSGYALCDGTPLQINQFDALFSILGATYGGNGRTDFWLPDLRGRFPMHKGSGPGLTPRQIGEKSGTEANFLTTGNMPNHSHVVSPPASASEGQRVEPDASYPAAGEEPIKPFSPQSDTTMAGYNTSSEGLSQPVDNMPPYQAVTFIIALVGTYPSRS